MKSYPNSIKLSNRLIGFSQPCFIIAEIGSNHNGSLSIAKELIDAAARAGADAIKFQTIKFSELYLERKTDRKIKEFIRGLELKEEWHQELKKESEKKGLIFLSTPTFLKAVDLLFNIGVKAFKIASAQSASDLELISYAASKGLPLFISTGLIDLKRVKKILGICQDEKNRQIVLLHCVSLYPTPPKKVRLLRILELQKHFGTIVGYSDHTLGMHFSVAAVSLGAKVIEKHLTLRRKMKGPDHFFSLEPKELGEMIRRIREVELGLSVNDGFSPEEIKLKKAVQLKWVATKDFLAGEKLDENYLIARRVSQGINIEKPLSHFLCAKDIKKGEVVKYKLLRRMRN